VGSRNVLDAKNIVPELWVGRVVPVQSACAEYENVAILDCGVLGFEDLFDAVSGKRLRELLVLRR
jgi:hypothetical protein